MKILTFEINSKIARGIIKNKFIQVENHNTINLESGNIGLLFVGEDNEIEPVHKYIKGIKSAINVVCKELNNQNKN